MLLGLNVRIPNTRINISARRDFRQDRMVLLVVINHKQPQNQQTTQNAENQLTRCRDVPKGAGQGG